MHYRAISYRSKLLLLYELLLSASVSFLFFFFQAEDGIRDRTVTGVQTCALPIFEPPVGGQDTLEAPEVVAGRRPAVEVLGYPAQEDLAVDRARPAGHLAAKDGQRSEERRVGKECRCRWAREQ